MNLCIHAVYELDLAFFTSFALVLFFIKPTHRFTHCILYPQFHLITLSWCGEINHIYIVTNIVGGQLI